MVSSTGEPLLLLTRDPAVASEVLRLAAAAGVAVDVMDAPGTGLRGWSLAPAVLVGADVAPEVTSVGPPRREEVHLLCLGGADGDTFRSAVGLGAASVLELPAGEAWLAELLSDVRDGGPGQGTVVAVVGGSGGAGASVLAAALATIAGAAGPAALLDLDPLGPGAQRVLGFDEATGVTWADLLDSEGRLGSRSLRDALPQRDGVGVLGWPPIPVPGLTAGPSSALVREVVSAAARGHDWVFLDLPRSTDLSRSDVLVRCDRVLLVARAAVGQVAAASRVAERLTGGAASVGLVVRTRRGSPPAEDVARAVGVPLLAEVPEQRRLDEHLDLGVGPVHSRRSPVARAAGRLLELMAEDR